MFLGVHQQLGAAMFEFTGGVESDRTAVSGAEGESSGPGADEFPITRIAKGRGRNAATSAKRKSRARHAK